MFSNTERMATAMDMDGVTIGGRVRAGRLAAGLSLRELAHRLEVSPATMSAVENGKTGISALRLQRIGEELDLSVAHLLRPPDGQSPREVASRPTGTPPDVVEDPGWRGYGPLVLDPVLSAALALIREKGYHGCTVREIADLAGLSMPGIYHHYRRKHDMLVALFDLTMHDLLRRSTAAREEGSTPPERFVLLVESIALFHLNRPELGFLGSSEMRSLHPDSRDRIAILRRDQQRMIDEEVEAAVVSGAFTTTHPHEAARAVVTMCTALPQWFDPRGPTSPQEMADLHVTFALNLVGDVDGIDREP